jgi:hypothetical protein
VGGWPKDGDAKKCIKALSSDFGWDYDTSVGKSAHITGKLLCGDGCRISVMSTGNNTARAVWKASRRCTHGKAPDRAQW